MSQAPLAIPLWEEVLSSVKFSRLIELGTWWGNMSLYFLLFCLNRNAEFITYDIVRRHNSLVKQLVKFDDHHRRQEIWGHKAEIATEMMKPGRTILYCDNGDKPKEVGFFSMYLKDLDILAVHDYGTEIFAEDIPDSLEPLETEVDDGMTKFFVKRETKH